MPANPASLVVAALILAAAQPAVAQLAPSIGGRAAVAGFNRLDRNGDGGVSMAEWSALGRQGGSARLFSLLDGDGDGRLAAREMGRANGPLLGRFDAYDVNKDGYVGRHEFPSFVDPRLAAALDRDDDRRLSLAELRPAFAGSGARPAAVAPPPSRAVRPAAPHRAMLRCWVTGFGDGDWIIEAPVMWGDCRTR